MPSTAEKPSRKKTPPKRKLISIVTPVYNEEKNVERCYTAVKALFENELAAYDREHIFCDNSSTDDTQAVLRALAKDDPALKLIFNARNFGILRSSFNALMATNGDGVVALFPVDLQDPVEVIPQFVKAWEEGHQVVYGARENRLETPAVRSIKNFYYSLVSRFSEIQIPRNVASFQFLDRKVVEALRKFDDYYPHLPNLIASCGFKRKEVLYTWRARVSGFSKNTVYHLIDEALNSLISFSKVPMRLCLAVGLGIALLSMGFAFLTFLIVVFRMVMGEFAPPPGIPTVIIALFFLAGVQLFVLGVLGEYIAAVHFQVRKRPLVIESERVNFPSE